MPITNMLAHQQEHRMLGINQSYPTFGQIIVSTSTKSRTFKFAANGSDERVALAAMFSYCQTELDAGRNTHVRLGIGKFGFDSNGFEISVAGGQTFTFLGSGSQTEFGWVGDTQITARFPSLKIESAVAGTQDIDVVAVAGDNVTVTITMNAGHNATVGSWVRVYQAGDEVTEGRHIVTAITATTLNFVTDVATVVSLGDDPRISIFNNFPVNVEVGNILFFDDNPAAHTSVGGEESHGLNLLSMIDPYIHNTYHRNIGDEGVEVTTCEGYTINDTFSVGTPSVQAAGGGLLSIRNGCHNGTIINVISRDPYNAGSSDLSYTLSIKTSGNSPTITGLTAYNIVGNYPEYSTVNFSTADADISNIKIYGVRATGGQRAITQTGSAFNLTNVDIYDLVATEQTIRPVDMARLKTNTTGLRFHNPVIDGSHLVSTTKELFRLNGTDNRIYNPVFTNASVAVYTNSTEGLIIQGGSMDNIGATGTTGYMIRDVNDGDTIFDNVQVTNCQSTTNMFFNVMHIINCPELHFAVTPSGGLAGNCDYIDNNKLINAAVRVGASGRSISFNEFTGTTGQTMNGATGMIVVSGNNTRVIGNKAPNMTSGNGIVEDTGQDNNIIKDNDMNGRPLIIVGANTLGADLVVRDAAGTGTETIVYNL